MDHEGGGCGGGAGAPAAGEAAEPPPAGGAPGGWDEATFPRPRRRNLEASSAAPGNAGDGAPAGRADGR